MPSAEHDYCEPFRGAGFQPPSRADTALIVIDMQNKFCHPQGARLPGHD